MEDHNGNEVINKTSSGEFLTIVGQTITVKTTNYVILESFVDDVNSDGILNLLPIEIRVYS